MSSSSSSDDDRKREDDRKRKRDGEDDDKAERKRRKKEKKERKKKEKKDRKKSEKKERKKDRRREKTQDEAVGDEEAAFAEEFRAAVQGGKRALDVRAQSDAFLHTNSVEIRAAELGLPKGLIRTAAGSDSITTAYSKGLFGGSGDMNPAQQQRRARENAAQRAVAKAKRVLAERAEASKDGAPSSESSGGLAGRFQGGSKLH